MTAAALLFEDVQRQLETWSDAAYPFETGGILLGLLGDGDPWIVEAVEIPSAVPQLYAYQLPAGVTHPAVRAAQARDPRLGYLGDWHSHPLDVRASFTDLGTYMGAIRRALRLHEQPPLMVVMRKTAGSWEVDLLARTGRLRRPSPADFVITGPPPPG